MPGFAALEAQIGEQAARQQVAEQGASDILRNTTISTGGIGALTGGGALGSAFQRVTTGAKGGLFGAVGRDAAKRLGRNCCSLAASVRCRTSRHGIILTRINLSSKALSLTRCLGRPSAG